MTSIADQIEQPPQFTVEQANAVIAQLLVREVGQVPEPDDGRLLQQVARVLDIDINHFFHKLVPLAQCVVGSFAEEINTIPTLEAQCSQVMAKIRKRRARHATFSSDRQQYERDEAFVRQQRREHNKIVTKLLRARDLTEHLRKTRERYPWLGEFERLWAEHQEVKPKRRSKKA